MRCIPHHLSRLAYNTEYPDRRDAIVTILPTLPLNSSALRYIRCRYVILVRR